MPAKAAKRRAATIAEMRESLAAFYPERPGQFLCPGCLQYSNDEQSLTDAHIVPKSVGGRLTTVLCVGCNGRFGTRRDKWLGEYIRLFRLDVPTILHEKEQRGYFYVGDVKVSGRYGVADDGTLQFLIWKDRTSPESLSTIPAQLKETVTRALLPSGPLYERERSLTVSLPPSLLYENRDYVTLGFLTAAYLTWFKAFGYSWALQHHLENVRQQIRSERLTVLPECHSAVMKGQRFDEPWIGFGEVNGELALFGGVAERVVIFPPADDPGLYDRLPQNTLEGSRLCIRRRIPIRPGHPQVDSPTGVVFDNRLVIRPDVFLRGRYPVIYVPEKGDVQVLHPVSDEDSKRSEEEHADASILIKSKIEMPTGDTGR